MSDRLRGVFKPRRLVGLLAVIVVAGIGTYLLAFSNAQSSDQTLARKSLQPSTAWLLKPVNLGTAPYQYVAYSSSLDDTRKATGINIYFAAFIISGGGCVPAWGGSAASGLSSPRATDIAADFSRLRAGGGEVALSFGGSNGAELAVTCNSADDLAAAYQSVIDKYALKRVDFDIEAAALTDTEAVTRRADAIVKLEHTNPELKVWITLPAHTKGLTPPGVALLTQLRDYKVVLAGINIMAMNYNIGSRDMGKQAIQTVTAAHDQISKLYPDIEPADLWHSLGITVMVGQNNTMPETLTLANAVKVRNFAIEKKVGLLSMWSIGRDAPCPGNAAPTQVSTSCSGVAQKPYDYLKALTL